MNPLTAIAAVAIIVFSAVGGGLMTGIIPSSRSANDIGGLLGNQIGADSAKTAVTLLGAVGDAVAGNEVEKRVIEPRCLRGHAYCRQVKESASPPQMTRA